MPYLPPHVIEGGQFPSSYGVDLFTEIKLIEESWRRHYPLIQYAPISKSPTAVTDITTQLSGQANTSKFDPMWGESIDSSIAVWQQPHASGTVQAAEPTLYQPPRSINARIQRVAREDTLKKIGFDRIRTLLLTIPTSLLDSIGVTCAAGDRFVWDNEIYEVLQWHPQGWRFNSTVKMYVWLNCEHAKRGS